MKGSRPNVTISAFLKLKDVYCNKKRIIYLII